MTLLKQQHRPSVISIRPAYGTEIRTGRTAHHFHLTVVTPLNQVTVSLTPADTLTFARHLNRFF